jgi:O-antigen/teichoic acid export membrane protein
MTSTSPPAVPGGLVSSTGLTLAARVAAFFFSLATNVILARSLGPEGRGVYAVAVLTPAIIGLFAQLGIGQANVYYFSRGLIDAEDLVGHAIALGLLLGTVCFLGVLAYVEASGSHRVAGIPSQLVLISSIGLPFTLVTVFLQGVLTGAQRFMQFNITLLAQYAAPTVALTITVIVFRG